MNLIHLKNFLKFLFQFSLYGLGMAFLVLLLFTDSFRPAQEIKANNIPITAKNPAEIVSYHDAISAVSPAVVNVYASRILTRRINPLYQDPLFRRFFGEPPPEQQVNNSLGSGVILNTDGYLLTNAHVIAGADDIQVSLSDGRQADAKVVGIDSETDLAVLHIQADDLPVAPIGDSETIRVGDVVLAIGNPYNFGQTVTQGIVSATRRNRVGINLIEDFIQTDAAINPGNSGGALINSLGEVIGINTAIFSESGGSQGIGFAIPVGLAIDVMQQLITRGFVERGWLGINAQPVPADMAAEANLDDSGILVTGVYKDSPAAITGIMPGDIILKINGVPLQDARQAIQKISGLQPGQLINLDILRGWKGLFLTAEVAQRPKFITE
ncbi:MAG: trypsin-like peptidase domain-containing protein [Gammaproteobacteria bacterium]